MSLDPVYVYFDADERTYLKYAGLARDGTRPSSRDARTPIDLGLIDEDGQFPHKGYVDFVDNTVNPETGTSGPARSSPTRTTRLPPASSPGSSWREAGSTGPRWWSTAPSARTRTRNSCSCSSLTAPVDYRLRASSGAWWTGYRVVTSASSRATK